MLLTVCKYNYSLFLNSKLQDGILLEIQREISLATEISLSFPVKCALITFICIVLVIVKALSYILFDFVLRLIYSGIKWVVVQDGARCGGQIAFGKISTDSAM